jgi:hypothetical protein
MAFKSVLLTIVTAAVLAGCGGSEGPQGPPGPQGPAGVPNRKAIYCRSVGDATLAGGYTLTASCDAAADFPVEGSCSSGTLPGNYYLGQSQPFAWDNNGASPAQWVCAWHAGTGDALVPTINGTSAWICCVPP